MISIHQFETNCQQYCYIVKPVTMSDDSAATQITLFVQSVKMKVKFSCKMRLELNELPITSQVYSNDGGKFIFNQQTLLEKRDDRQPFQITVNLITGKVAKYVAGIIKFALQDLIRQEGQIIILPLQKCIDPNACCELRIRADSERIKKTGDRLPAHHSRELSRNFSPPIPKQLTKNAKGTKSELQFSKNVRFELDREGLKNQQVQGSQSNPSSSIYNFRKANNFAATQVEKQMLNYEIFNSTERDRLIEGEVYKQNYQKLKQKCKRDAESAKTERIAAENNENNLKFQIMRIKLRSEEQQKVIDEKKRKIKELQSQLVALHKKELDSKCLIEENSNKDHKIRMLEDTIRTLTRDNQDLRSGNRLKEDSDKAKLKELKNELENMKQKYEKKQEELEKQIRLKYELMSQKDAEIRQSYEKANRDKLQIIEKSKTWQSKCGGLEASIKNERAEWKQKMESLKSRVHSFQIEHAEFDSTLKQLRKENQRLKASSLKMEYEKKMLVKEATSYKTEISSLKAIKQELSHSYKIQVEQNGRLQKALEKAVQKGEANICQVNRQNQEEVQLHKKSCMESEDRLKQLHRKFFQQQTLLRSLQQQFQAVKVQSEQIKEQKDQLGEKQHSLQKALKLKEQQLSTAAAEAEFIKNKLKLKQQQTQYELSYLNEALSKAKKDFEAQKLKNESLSQKSTNTEQELNKCKMQLQQHQEQTSKIQSNSSQKAAQFQCALQQRKKEIERLQGEVVNLHNLSREQMSRCQILEKRNEENCEQKQKWEKELRNGLKRCKQVQIRLRAIENECDSSSKEKERLMQNLLELENKISENSENIHIVTADKIKYQKENQVLNRQLQGAKKQIQKKMKTIAMQESKEQNLKSQVNACKEKCLVLETKSAAIKREYDRFKEQILEASKAYSQMPLPNVSKISFQSIGVKDEGEAVPHSIDIVNKISFQNRDIKAAMSALIEQNKSLEKQLSLMGDYEKNLQQIQSHNDTLLKHAFELEGKLQKQRVQHEQTKNSLLSLHGNFAQLTEELIEQQSINKKLWIQIEELNIMVGNLKRQNEANHEQHELRVMKQKSRVKQYQQKQQHLLEAIEKAELKNQELEDAMGRCVSEVEMARKGKELKEKEKQLQEVMVENKKLMRAAEEGKANRKQLLEKASSLELRLLEMSEMKERGEVLLRNEENKNKQMKTLIDNLMKQKQENIKSQLIVDQQVMDLQNSISKLQLQLEAKSAESSRLSATVHQQKQQLKKCEGKIKQIQAINATNAKKMNEMRVAMEGRLEETKACLVSSQKQYLRKVSVLQQYKEKQQKEHEQNKCQQQRSQAFRYELQQKLGALEQEIFRQKQTTGVQKQQIQKQWLQIQQLRRINKAQQEQIEGRDEAMYELSGKIYDLELEMKKMLKLKEEAAASQSKMKMVADQNDFLVEKVGILEEDYRSLLEGVERMNEESEALLQQEEEYCRLILQKERKIEELSLEVQQWRKKMQLLEHSKNAMQKQMRAINKAIQEDLNVLKKKEVSRNSRECLDRMQWGIEKEIKRVIGLYSKKLVPESSRSREMSVRMLESIKNMEDEVIAVVASKMSEQQ